MLSRFFASRNLRQDDGAIFLRSFLENPTPATDACPELGAFHPFPKFERLIDISNVDAILPKYLSHAVSPHQLYSDVDPNGNLVKALASCGRISLDQANVLFR